MLLESAGFLHAQHRFLMILALLTGSEGSRRSHRTVQILQYKNIIVRYNSTKILLYVVERAVATLIFVRSHKKHFVEGKRFVK